MAIFFESFVGKSEEMNFRKEHYQLYEFYRNSSEYE